MMQRHARAADFLHQRLTTRLDFFEIGRTESFLGGPGENQIGHLQVADRAIVSSRKRVDFLARSGATLRPRDR